MSYDDLLTQTFFFKDKTLEVHTSPEGRTFFFQMSSIC